jgi:hypothetical protein
MYSYTLEEKSHSKSNFLHKMANYKIIKKYLENSLFEGDVYDDIYV